MLSENIRIARLTWQRFRATLGLLVKSESGPKALMLSGFLIVFMIAINGLNVLNSYVGRDFMSAIENKNMGAFQYQALLYGAVFLASTLAAVFYSFTEARLGILWREQLTRRLVETYMSDRTYYRLDSATGVANPDQRITDDVRAFTSTTLSFILLFLNGTLTAISFSGVLWSISPTLFGVAVAYAVCGSVLTILLGKPLIRLNYNQLDMEANFRSDLIHIRENSESIALAHREGRFKARLSKRLDSLTANFRRLIRINRNLGFFTTGYNYLIQIIPALIVAPLFILGSVSEFGVITQSTMAFATLLGAFSIIVTQFQSISAFTAVTARLYKLSDAMEKAHQATTCAIEIGEHPDQLEYKDLTLYSSDKSRLLIENLNLQIARGSRWIITAADDAQKVALFRATASVWECGGGRISRPSLENVLFLPERPYLPPGNLRDVLLRTGMENTTQDSEIIEILTKFHLQDIVTRAGGIGVEQDWDDLLSIGEQHLISICRIFLAKPAFVFLDRPGSSLPQNLISEILDFLTIQNIGVVILSKNGESRLRYDGHLQIHPDGNWQISRAERPVSQTELDDLNC
jgi:vitamin B12/bleomycin/antimicrobial peptide transport system ATP-binding/permease protein